MHVRKFVQIASFATVLSKIAISQTRCLSMSAASASPLYPIKVTTIKGEEVEFEKIAAGKVNLIVNGTLFAPMV